MERFLKRIDHPDDLSTGWDDLAGCYFQKREFLAHLHRYNYCDQRYYELYMDGKLVAGGVVYTLKIDLFTFSGMKSPVNMQVIGLPVSVASEPLVGNPEEFRYLLGQILQRERGLIAGLNFIKDHINGITVNMRTLPTVVLRNHFSNMNAYVQALRHPYRRRIRLFREQFSGIQSETTGCSSFTMAHYALYLQIMKRTKTKLETLSFESFKFLPSNFLLTTYYDQGEMLCWHILCKDDATLFFYFGGMDYTLRDRFGAYYNNLMGILEKAMEEGYTEIDLGQTAEIAKMRLGGVLSERRMFLYHRNALFLKFIKLFRKMINYNQVSPEHHVFRDNGV